MDLTAKDVTFADRYARKLCTCWGAPCTEDIISAAYEGLVVAADSFDPAFGTDFYYWASIHIKQVIVEQYREMFGRKRKQAAFFETHEYLPFDENCGKLSTNGLEDKLIWKDLYEKLWQCVTTEQKEYLDLRFRLHKTNLEIAAEKNVKVDGVNNQFWVIKKKAIELRAK